MERKVSSSYMYFGDFGLESACLTRKSFSQDFYCSALSVQAHGRIDLQTGCFQSVIHQLFYR